MVYIHIGSSHWLGDFLGYGTSSKIDQRSPNYVELYVSITARDEPDRHTCLFSVLNSRFRRLLGPKSLY